MRAMGPTSEQMQQAVRERYAAAARAHLQQRPDPGCGCGSHRCSGPHRPDPADTGGCCASSCCAQPAQTRALDPITSDLYDPSDTPSDAALAASLGCGNPTALAALAPGEDVLDLGSGGGLDVLLSARRVAPGGTAYGLDMTPQMRQLAERHRAEAGVENARFLLGVIEDIPLPDQAVDVVISNCVINLSGDKDAVLREAFRVLRPGGRLAVSDIVLLREIPDALRGVLALWTGCICGALRDRDYVAKLTATGFQDAAVEVTRTYGRHELEAMADALEASHLPPGTTMRDAVEALDGAFASAFVRASKPAS